MTADQARSILASLIAVQGHGAAGPEPGDRPGRSVPAASTAVEATINVDGASRGNPGKAGLGVIIREEPGGRVVRKISRYLGETTNNVAEYSALIAALEAARELGLRRIRVLADSELMVRQIKGLYKVRNEGLRPLHARAAALIKSFDRFEIRHVPRGRNSEADAMANAAIDARK
ncbi:MAG TPA: ribonuclease HI family protein [Deltaproteobacteria bacterium]|nr:ribonuclease HI family protein [Deltaproteobacteria bacterium]